MATVQANEIDLLIAIRDRLRQEGKPEFDSATCFLSDEPLPAVFPSKEPICTVCLSDQRYDTATYAGAGPNALCEAVPILITLLNRCVLDAPPRAEQALIHDSRGLLKLRRRVLQALLLSSTQECASHGDLWIPLNVDGDQFLVERGLIPQGCTSPRYMVQGDRSFLGVTITLIAQFDQDLLRT